MESVNGFDNEFLFVKCLNNKKVCDLNILFYDLIHDLFYDINDDYVIKCWRNHLPQKADILIRIGNTIKGVSIKKGMKNSVHVERLSDFIVFLNNCGISDNIINKYLMYHFGDGSIDGSGKKRLSVSDYKLEHQNDIDEVNEYFNEFNFLNKVIERFVIKGNNSNYYIDAIIYGEVDDFFWIKANDIKNVILSKRNNYSSAIHFGSLTIQPKNRCLNYNPKYNNDRYLIQVKWYNLYDEIIEFMNNRVLKQKSFQEFMDDL